MELSPRLRRRLFFLGAALALVVAGRLAGWGRKGSSGPAPVGDDEPVASHATPPISVPLRHPPSALAELGVLTNQPDEELAALLDRATLATLVRPDLCGDEDACAAVRAAVGDAHTTTLQVLPASAWHVAGVDLDASAPGLSASERASVGQRARVVVVRVATAPSPRQLAVRAAFAVVAAIARKTDGLVFDQLLGRIETAEAFAAHAVTAPLDASAFRKDRVELLFEPRAPGIVRMLTTGLSRWGKADVEAVAVPTAAVDRIADIVLGVAEALANGATSGPVSLTRDDLARVRGVPYPADPDRPAATPVAVDLVPAHPEGGDPNDFMARIEAPEGEGPLAYIDLSARFFGEDLAASPDEATLRTAREKAQHDLPAALARSSRGDAAHPKVLVRLPFPIAGDGGTESMWVEVERYDAKTVTGKLVDDPLGATEFHQGDSITRPRDEVEDLSSR
jgi:uncharacterized protein YegJ (DUF2314 family)